MWIFDKVGTANLSYGAAYAPWLLIHRYRASLMPSCAASCSGRASRSNSLELTSDRRVGNSGTAGCRAGRSRGVLQRRTKWLNWRRRWPIVARLIATSCTALPLTIPCPPSGALVGIYARVDQNRGMESPGQCRGQWYRRFGCLHSTAEQELLLNVGQGNGQPIQIPGQGWVVWGLGRWPQPAMKWRHVPVRRIASDRGIDSAIGRTPCSRRTTSPPGPRVNTLGDYPAAGSGGLGLCRVPGRNRLSSSAAAWANRRLGHGERENDRRGRPGCCTACGIYPSLRLPDAASLSGGALLRRAPGAVFWLRPPRPQASAMEILATSIVVRTTCRR